MSRKIITFAPELKNTQDMDTTLENILPFALLAFTSFFTLTNPLGTMPVFLSMTAGLSEDERKKIAKKATFTAFLILIAFTVSGKFLFQFFGISTDGFRIAGGFIIFKIGYDMLQAKFSHIKLNDKEQEKHYTSDISITPLAIPMLCGPGAIANGIVMMNDATSIALKLVLVGVIATVFIIGFVILRASTRLLKFLGETGNNVMMRLMGLILMVIGVECFVSGAKPMLVDILEEAFVFLK